MFLLSEKQDKKGRKCLTVMWLVAELELSPSPSEIQIQAAFAQTLCALVVPSPMSQSPVSDVEQLPGTMDPQHDDTALDFPTDCPSHRCPLQGPSASQSETLTQRLEEDRVYTFSAGNLGLLPSPICSRTKLLSFN